jgi:hypothetical protein
MTVYYTGNQVTNAPIIGWHSVLRTQDITASSSATARPVINLWAPDTAMLWEPTADDASITLFNSTGSPVDYIAMARHNFAADAISYAIEVSTDGTTFTALKALKAIAHESPIIEVFTPQIGPYFKISFDHASGVKPRLAHIKLGELLTLPRHQFVGQKPSELALYAEGTTQMSENGQYLGRINTSTSRKGSCTQKNISQAFVYSKIKPFSAHANCTAPNKSVAQGAYFYSWRPADFPNDIVYGWTAGTIHAVNEQPNSVVAMAVDFDIEAIA